MRRCPLYCTALQAAAMSLLGIFYCLDSTAQVTNISGIVNSYYAVTAVVPSKNCVTVSNPAGLTPFTKILLIQMKGASVNTSSSTSSAFGDTTSLGDAGNYEVNYICYVKDDSVFFSYTMLNSYSSTGKVQLVPFARYANATVTDTVKARTWNSTTGTGGVIAIDVVDTLVLNAPVYADSSGFRGGSFVQSSGSCFNFAPASSFAYPASNTGPQNGAYKGESVATSLPSNMTGGKGAPANGGGGGNNHNNSGGGGANLSAGGLGGGNSSETGTSTCYITNRGIGGKPLSNWGGKKIFSGGGGGAGHNNGGLGVLPSIGGNGGGIIFIHADTIIGNGYKITAGGGRGGGSLSDGSGGGGAGGTIIMDVNTYIGSTIVQANGGAGGNTDDGGNVGLCYGGGGGGSGGVIYFTSTVPAITVYDTAGAAGLEVGRYSISCSTIQPAAAGSAGQTIPNYSIRQATVFSSTCGIPLPVNILYFKAGLLSNKQVALSWKIASPELVQSFIIERKNISGQWESIQIILPRAMQEVYTTIDANPLEDNFYRLRIIETNTSSRYSSIRHIVIQPNETFSIYPIPARHSITIKRNTSAISALSITTVNGQSVFSTQVTGNIVGLSLPSLPKGVYVLRLDGAIRKLVIQ